MNTTSPPPQTALDELLRRNPTIDPALLAQVRRDAEMLRQFGLLSTEPAEAIRPFTRRPQEPNARAPVSGWAAARSIQFTKVEQPSPTCSRKPPKHSEYAEP
jgi:hypothetical protein